MRLADFCALRLQELRREDKVDGEQPLLRIDYRREAADAPFQFDMVQARLHRTGCREIGQDSRSALYAVWEVRPEDLEYACPKCRPVPAQEQAVEDNRTPDVLYGFISILDQFGSVLNERGKEYRNSERGRQVEKMMDGLVSQLDQRQREVLDAMLSSLDHLLKAVDGYNQSLQGQNGNHSGNGRGSTAEMGIGRRREEKT